MSNALFPSAVRGLTYTVLKTPEFSTIVQKAPNGYETRIPQYQNPIWHFTLIYDYLYDTYRSPNNTQAYAPYTDLQYLLGFFAMNRGQASDFLFLDTTDYAAVGPLAGNWQPGLAYAVGTVIIDPKGHAQRVNGAGISGTSQPFWNDAGGTTADNTVSWLDVGFAPQGYVNEPAPLAVVTDGLGNYYSPLQRSIAGLYQEDVTDLVPNTLQVFGSGAPISGYQVRGPGLAVPGAAYAGLYLSWGAAQPPQPVTATFQFYFRVRFETDTQDFERWAQGLWTIGGDNSKNGSGMLKLRTSRPVAA